VSTLATEESKQNRTMLKHGCPAPITEGSSEYVGRIHLAVTFNSVAAYNTVH
jgi:hypothetical protein